METQEVQVTARVKSFLPKSHLERPTAEAQRTNTGRVIKSKRVFNAWTSAALCWTRLDSAGAHGACTRLCLPRDGDAFGVDILGGDGFFQFVQLSSLLEFLHQTFHRLFTPFLLLAVLLSLFPAQKSLDNGGSERQN